VFRGGLPEWIKAGYPTVTVEKLPKVNAPVVTPQQLKTMLDSNEDFVLLDIRLAVDEARYWIEDSRRLNISLNKLPADYVQIPKGKKLVLIDKIGKRAGVAARFLAAKGFDNITVTSGGMNDWIKSGLPTKINK